MVGKTQEGGAENSMTNPSTMNPLDNPVKWCRYGCGTLIYRDESIHGPPHIKLREKNTGLLHDLNRCCHIISEKEKKQTK
jgi:hypothetical protein